jgi:Cu+-exporting ATPase
VAVAVDGRLRLLLGIADALRPDSPAGVARLRALGLQPVLATGDTLEAAAATAHAAGITSVHAGLLPAGKSALVQQLRRERGSVAMVGDGINDAPALAAADIGIAVATGTGAAMAAADITLVHGGVGAVADAVSLTHATRWIIRQNLGLVFGLTCCSCRWAAPGSCRPYSPPWRWPPARSPSSATRCGCAASAKQADTGHATPHGMVVPRAGAPPGYQSADEHGHRRIDPARADRPRRRKSRCLMRPRDGSCVLTINAACASLVEGT